MSNEKKLQEQSIEMVNSMINIPHMICNSDWPGLLDKHDKQTSSNSSVSTNPKYQEYISMARKVNSACQKALTSTEYEETGMRIRRTFVDLFQFCQQNPTHCKMPEDRHGSPVEDEHDKVLIIILLLF